MSRTLFLSLTFLFGLCAGLTLNLVSIVCFSFVARKFSKREGEGGIGWLQFLGFLVSAFVWGGALLGIVFLFSRWSDGYPEWVSYARTLFFAAVVLWFVFWRIFGSAFNRQQ